MSEYALLHTTSTDCLARIANEGLLGVSYWAEPGPVSCYYVETVEDEDKQPAVLRLPLSLIEAFQPEPDHPGLQEPLTHTLGMNEEEVWEQWEETDQSWQACLDLIGSIRLRAPIPASVMVQYNPQLRKFLPPENKPSSHRM